MINATIHNLKMPKGKNSKHALWGYESHPKASLGAKTTNALLDENIELIEYLVKLHKHNERVSLFLNHPYLFARRAEWKRLLTEESTKLNIQWLRMSKIYERMKVEASI